MTITLRKSESRQHLRDGTRETWETFGGDHQADPLAKGFRALESLSEHNLAPGGTLNSSFEGHAEVITYVQDGILRQEVSSNGAKTLRAGVFQRGSVHPGLNRRGQNDSNLHSAHVIVTALTSTGEGSESGGTWRHFPVAERRGVLRLIASHDGEHDSLRVPQDVRIYSSLLDQGHHQIHELTSGRGAWLHVVKGGVLMNDHFLRGGDGAAIAGEAAVSFTAREPSEILLYDLA